MDVTSQSPQQRSVGYTLTDKQFGVIAEMAEQRFGLSLPASKKPLVLSRLSKRLRLLGLSEFDDYLDLLRKPDTGPEETNNLLSSLTTNVTHFFRERHHFDTLRTEILPSLVQSAKNGGRVRLWSAGCSSGQEAYCIAMTLLEACPQATSLNLKLLATDIDPAILARAKEGEYRKAEVSEKDLATFQKHFDFADGEKIRAGANLRRLISFGEINLVHSWPVKGPFDVIFCRNVAIYFEKETQARLWDKFASVMRPGAYLFIGHSERIANPANFGFQPCGVTTYRYVGGRRDAGQPPRNKPE